MMPSQSLTGSQQATNINHIQNSMMNLVYNFTSIVTMPVEIALRPFYGTRYFPPVILFFSAAMMIILPLLFSFAGAVGNMIPFVRFRGSLGFIGMSGLSRLFFLGLFVHGFRTWRLMLHMGREEHSQFEGPPLFFFGNAR
jgi:hypothetical protein